MLYISLDFVFNMLGLPLLSLATRNLYDIVKAFGHTKKQRHIYFKQFLWNARDFYNSTQILRLLD